MKQLDFDGKYAYSPILSLQKIGEKGDLKIYPNPVSNQSILTIDLSENKEYPSAIAIFNANGQCVYYNKSVNESVLKVDVKDWSNGLHLLHLTTIEGKTMVYKFVKN